MRQLGAKGSPPSPAEREQLDDYILSIVQRSDLWFHADRPEVVTALMVTHLCRYLGVAHECMPQVLLATLASIGDPSAL